MDNFFKEIKLFIYGQAYQFSRHLYITKKNKRIISSFKENNVYVNKESGN